MMQYPIAMVQCTIDAIKQPQDFYNLSIMQYPIALISTQLRDVRSLPVEYVLLVRNHKNLRFAMIPYTILC